MVWDPIYGNSPGELPAGSPCGNPCKVCRVGKGLMKSHIRLHLAIQGYVGPYTGKINLWGEQYQALSRGI
jgi:hypothetical protein